MLTGGSTVTVTTDPVPFVWVTVIAAFVVSWPATPTVTVTLVPAGSEPVIVALGFRAGAVTLAVSGEGTSML